MFSDSQESANARLFRLIHAISEVDRTTLKEIVTENIQLDVPGAHDVDITQSSLGHEPFCLWAQKLREKCGKTTFDLHRYFENGCEMMANGFILIERHPRDFKSPCAIHVSFEQGRVAAFQLLLDTYALEKFRGQMD